MTTREERRARIEKTKDQTPVCPECFNKPKKMGGMYYCRECDETWDREDLVVWQE